MKESVLITSFPLESNFGGGEKMDLLLAESFREKNVNVYFWGGCPVLLREFKKLDFPTKKAFFVKDITSIRSLLLSPVYILSLLIQGLINLLFYWKKGVKKIVMLSLIEQIFLTLPAKLLGYDVFWWHHIPPRKPLIKNPFFLIWKLFSRFSVIIIPSEFVKKEFLKLNPSNLKILYNAVNLKEPSKSLDNKFVFDNDNIIIGMGGRLSPEKGVLEFAKLAKDFPEYNFIMAGTGVLKSDLEDFIISNNLSNLRLLGYVEYSRMIDFMSGLDIFCVLSEYESFGLSAAEASSLGIPVIASRVAALPEVILDNKTGLLYEYGNYEDLKEKFTQLVNDDDLRRKLGSKGKKYIAEKFLFKNFSDRAWNIIFENHK